MKWRLFPKRRFRNKVSFRSKLTTSIDLLRHGVTENSQRYCGSTNYPLTALGWTQMWHAINSQSTQWQHIVTSPLARCADFAHAMEQHYSIPVTQDDRIREIHFGDWEDRSSAELMHTDTDALSRFWQIPSIIRRQMANICWISRHVFYQLGKIFNRNFTERRFY